MKWGIVGLVGLLTACELPTDYRVSAVTPGCPNPVPVLTYLPQADTVFVPLGCPYAYINLNGDTLIATYQGL